MAKVFYYKGYIGIQCKPDSEALIAVNMGCVCDASKMQISARAIQALKTIRKNHGSFGTIEIFKSNDNKVIFGWLGGYYLKFRATDAQGSRDFNPDLLIATENVEIPKEFIEIVDKSLE